MDFLEKHLNKILGTTTIISTVQFLASLFACLDDGKLSMDEIHTLLISSSGIETVLIMVIVTVIKIRDARGE